MYVSKMDSGQTAGDDSRPFNLKVRESGISALGVNGIVAEGSLDGVAAQLDFHGVGGNRNSEIRTFLQIVGQKIPSGLPDDRAAVGDGGSLVLVVILGPSAVGGEKERDSGQHHWSNPFPQVAVVLRCEIPREFHCSSPW